MYILVIIEMVLHLQNSYCWLLLLILLFNIVVILIQEKLTRVARFQLSIHINHKSINRSSSQNSARAKHKRKPKEERKKERSD